MIDSHCHLNDSRFAPDREEVIRRAKEGGVSLLVNIGSGYGFEGNIDAIKIARENSHYIFISLGIHPHDAKIYSEKIENELKNLIGSNRDILVGIGEIGLDFHYNLSPREEQIKVFKKMIGIAREYSLPIIIHSRDAEPDTFKILKDEHAEKIGGVMHCFSGNVDLAKKYIEELGFYISISGVVTFKNANTTAKVAKEIPLEWLFAETDSPFLTPVPYRGKRNEPLYVKFVYQKIAELKEIQVEKVETEIDKNIKKLFFHHINANSIADA